MISAQAAVYQYSVFLDGPSDGNTSPGIGNGTVDYDDVLHTLSLQVSFRGLVTTNGAGTTVSHIHAATALPFTGTAAVATTTPTLPGFPASVFSGTYAGTLDLTLASSYNAAFVTANGGTTATAEAALELCPSSSAKGAW